MRGEERREADSSSLSLFTHCLITPLDITLFEGDSPPQKQTRQQQDTHAKQREPATPAFGRVPQSYLYVSGGHGQRPQGVVGPQY